MVAALPWYERLALRRPRDFAVGPEDSPYMERWWVIRRNPIFNIYLHRFWHSDDDEALHDHPWINCSILLKGRYVEVTDSGHEQMHFEGDVIFRWPSTPHRIIVNDPPVWSLFITGPVVRNWGFHCKGGWRSWQEYTDGKKGTKGKGCG